MKMKDFLNKDFLLERIKDCEGLSEIEQKNATQSHSNLPKVIWEGRVHEGNEENIEKYALNCFNNSIIYEDYKCFH